MSHPGSRRALQGRERGSWGSSLFLTLVGFVAVLGVACNGHDGPCERPKAVSGRIHKDGGRPRYTGTYQEAARQLLGATGGPDDTPAWVRLSVIPPGAPPVSFEIAERGEGARLVATELRGTGRNPKRVRRVLLQELSSSQRTLIASMLREKAACSAAEFSRAGGEDGGDWLLEVTCDGQRKSIEGQGGLPEFLPVFAYVAWLSGLDPNAEEVPEGGTPAATENAARRLGWPFSEKTYSAVAATYCPKGTTLVVTPGK